MVRRLASRRIERVQVSETARQGGTLEACAPDPHEQRLGSRSSDYRQGWGARSTPGSGAAGRGSPSGLNPNRRHRRYGVDATAQSTTRGERRGLAGIGAHQSPRGIRAGCVGDQGKNRPWPCLGIGFRHFRAADALVRLEMCCPGHVKHRNAPVTSSKRPSRSWRARRQAAVAFVNGYPLIEIPATTAT